MNDLLKRLMLATVLLTGCAEGDPVFLEPASPGSATLGLETEDPDESQKSDEEGAVEENASAPESYESLEETYHHSEVALVSQGDATLLPFVEPMRRARQRMTIPQLSDSLVRVTGGIGWTESNGGVEEDLFEVFAASLGVPDYVEATREDRAASALFHKFLDEAARYACSELVVRETSGQPYESQLMVHANATDTLTSAPEAVDANLRYLLLRYHGRKLHEDAPALTPWRWLFESVSHVSGDPAIGWRSVCIALVSHPDFYSY